MSIAVRDGTNHTPSGKRRNQTQNRNKRRNNQNGSNAILEPKLLILQGRPSRCRMVCRVEQNIHIGSKKQREKDHVRRKPLRRIILDFFALGFRPGYVASPQARLIHTHKEFLPAQEAQETYPSGLSEVLLLVMVVVVLLLLLAAHRLLELSCVLKNCDEESQQRTQVESTFFQEEVSLF